MLSDSKIQDFIDDRLSPRDRTAVCLELALDPALAQYVQQLCLMNCILRGVGAPILDEPIPEQIMNTIREARLSLDQ